MTRAGIPGTIAVILLAQIVSAGESKLVKVGADGKLVYAPYSDKGDCIPDFSNCGYMGGGVKLPEAPVRETLAPQAGDQRQRIQDAIDKVSALPADAAGLRGAVLLTKGIYEVGDTIYIRSSGVVLRGEGDGDKGTVLVAAAKRKHTLIAVGGSGKAEEVKGTRHAIVDDYVSVGAHSFSLDSTQGLAVGDEVIVARHGNQEWIHTLGADKLNRGPDDPVKNWQPLTLSFQRVVTKIEGNKVTIDAPIACAIERQWGGGEVYKYQWPGRLRHVGVENLRGQSQYSGETDEKHAWDMVHIGAVQDAWVRNVTAVHFAYSCVNASATASRVTVQDCQCLDPISKITGGRRYSFALAGQLALVQRCYARNGRHDFVMHARVPGPNAFVDCKAEKAHADSGPHHRWSAGTLYDNVTCGPLNVQNRGRSGTGHGWAGSVMVFWNCTATSLDCQKPPTSQNFAIGCITPKMSGKGHIESPGRPVEPRSLYRAQLQERLGKEAVESVGGAPR
ncbi:MAG: hypothetical protein LLG01_02240 [Planctomycetaceae bacterium]|nr:hypothetical protein [Planctomycetaceae bacterium]